MSPPVLEITHAEEFAAAHRLVSPDLSDAENRELFGPCETVHGHNYTVEVTVRGPLDERSGMVMDLNRLMQLMRREIFDVCDHQFLNVLPLLAGRVPTAESFAVALWKRLAPEIDEVETCRLHRVRVFESRQNWVEYAGPDA